MRATRHRRAPESVEITSSGIAQECEAFLAGTFIDVMHEGRRLPPVWTWLNDAAHGSTERLQGIAAGEAGGDVEVTTRATIARAVLCAGADRDLLELQRSSLIPLELRIAGTELTPRRLVELVGRALYL
jgi:hypothetical protein